MPAEAPNIYVAVVDDDESLCRSMARVLRAAGMQAVTYLSAEAFLDDAKRPRFDCILLDIRLGGMSGIELNRRLIAAGSAPPVLFLTANADEEVREEALSTPCAGYLKKTDSSEDVLDAVREAARMTGHETRGVE